LENIISSIPNIDDDSANTLRSNLPKKFEFVGNVLMIPSETFNCTEWENIIKGDEAISFWEGLAKCFGLSRVARKSKIDSGPKRESKVLLLLPPYGQPQETGPSSVGWVTVTENSVQYSFDITRVMFCSGNITEKIRMSKELCAGQTIVDLYCGIGYYTLPFLIHGNAAYVHACEWNSNSVLALTENFKNNRIHSSRYSIYENDNRITAPTLRNVADRVCLGLLPSSEQGWPLAAIVLKPSGGILHVHENVNDNNIENFSEYLLIMLGKFFHNEGKNFNFKIIKTEKVKSYAPHVLHIVFDVLCIPI
jgi:tRNA wybutosine-synthesizing protein 3